MFTKFLIKQKLIAVTFVVGIIFAIAIGFYMNSASVVIETSEGITYNFDVEIAKDSKKRAEGLMFRESMPSNKGMLFKFEDDKVRIFWMKNTLISLDIMFIDKEGRIKKIHKMASPESLMPISSDIPVSYVLEINGGLTDKLKIKEDDIVLFFEGFSF